MHRRSSVADDNGASLHCVDSRYGVVATNRRRDNFGGGAAVRVQNGAASACSDVDGGGDHSGARNTGVSGSHDYESLGYGLATRS